MPLGGPAAAKRRQNPWVTAGTMRLGRNLPKKCKQEDTIMCGIVGYIGPDQATPFLLEGLSKLE